MKQLNVIGAIPYKFCKEFCHLLKQRYMPAIQTAGRILGRQLPEKSVLVPIPGCKGKPEYTLDMAQYISGVDIVWHDKEAVVLDLLRCEPHPSLCYQKKIGGAIDAINIKMSVLPWELDLLKDLVDRGYAVVLVDNVVDTGKTARSCIDAICQAAGEDIDISVMAIGDTGVHGILCEEKLNKIQ